MDTRYLNFGEIAILLRTINIAHTCVVFHTAGLSHQHKRLVLHQDLSEALLVLPDGQLQPLPEDLIVAWRVGQVGERVDLLLQRAFL